MPCITRHIIITFLVMNERKYVKKEEKRMESIVEKLQEELNCATVIKVPFLSKIPLIGTDGISESIVVTWIIMAVLILFSIIMTRNLKVHNISKRQAVIELIVTKVTGMVEDMIGEEGKQYTEYLATVLIYIVIANIIGIFGFKSPTKDLCVTIALAVMSIVLIEYAGIHRKGVVKWLHSFLEPVAIIAPINVLEVFIRPLSLCMRLFGNILGAFVIMELLKMLLPVFVPAVFSLYFDLFDGAIQAYVFVFLTSLFIKEAVEVEEA